MISAAPSAKTRPQSSVTALLAGNPHGIRMTFFEFSTRHVCP
jgi:hypothetical protein